MIASTALGFPAAACNVLRGAHERYGVADSIFYLLRPDAYVAARRPPRRGAKLIEHLAGIFT